MTNQESAQSVKTIAHNIAHNIDPVTRGGSGKFPKTDARYWRARVLRNVRTVAGQRREDEHFSIQIMHAGRREWFNTGESEKGLASAKAAEIYRSLDRFGWDATLAQFKPGKVKPEVPAADAVPKLAAPKVGDYLRLVEEWAGLSASTLASYSKMLRLIVAEIGGIKKDASRFNAHAGGGLAKWRGKVDALPLDIITRDAVQKWRLAFLKRAGAEPTAQMRAKVSCNSIIRQARSLFSKRVLGLISARVALPSPLPFEGVEVFKKLRSHLRYQSKVDARALLLIARDELTAPDKDGKTRLEQFKVLVLALCCGLRRNEMDKLTWRQVDLDAGVLRIETTRFFKAKSDESNATVDIEPELVPLLRGWRARANKSEFVIESEIRPRMSATYSHYRTDALLTSLMAWLRAKGVDDRKPLHTLRKEYGSIVADKLGIYAASRALRHGDVQVTATHYLDKKQRITTGLGSVFLPDNVKTADFAGDGKAMSKKKAAKRRA